MIQTHPYRHGQRGIMIGQLTFWVAARRHTATLNEHLTWQCDDSAIAAYLEKTFPVHAAEGLSNLAVGRHGLYQTAERLGGRVHVPTKTNAGQAPELV
ncbi:MAG: hypothetical protein AAGH99_05150 [Planctomycetota bacterium]